MVKLPKSLKKAGESNAVFETKNDRLIDFFNRVEQDGPSKLVQMKSHSFGMLTEPEWNTMFSKHLDHHLNQFGV